MQRQNHISIIIPAAPAAAGLDASIGSELEQTLLPRWTLEVVVVADGCEESFQVAALKK